MADLIAEARDAVKDLTDAAELLTVAVASVEGAKVKVRPKAMDRLAGAMHRASVLADVVSEQLEIALCSEPLDLAEPDATGYRAVLIDRLKEMREVAAAKKGPLRARAKVGHVVVFAGDDDEHDADDLTEQ